jgi:hypothetical protein
VIAPLALCPVCSALGCRVGAGVAVLVGGACTSRSPLWINSAGASLGCEDGVPESEPGVGSGPVGG